MRHDYVNFGFDETDVIIRVAYELQEFDPARVNPRGVTSGSCTRAGSRRRSMPTTTSRSGSRRTYRARSTRCRPQPADGSSLASAATGSDACLETN